MSLTGIVLVGLWFAWQARGVYLDEIDRFANRVAESWGIRPP